MNAVRLSTDEVRAAVARVVDGVDRSVLFTGATGEHLSEVRAGARAAGLVTVEQPHASAIGVTERVRAPVGRVAVVTAGTSDIPVAEEAVIAATLWGVESELITDVGVAGLHRLSAVADHLEKADAVVVVAGMEGALAGVVGSLTTRPVIACPTSVGYGASFRGMAALLAMLAGRTPGVACVDVDDGAGAGFVAARIARNAARRPGTLPQ